MSNQQNRYALSLFETRKHKLLALIFGEDSCFIYIKIKIGTIKKDKEIYNTANLLVSNQVQARKAPDI